MEDTRSSSIADRLKKLQPKHWGLIALGVVLLFVMIGSGGSGVDPQNWNCENIKDDIIAMSQEESLTVLEIGNVQSENKTSRSLDCRASAEWSQGYGLIEYGAYVSDGENLILQYRQM